MPVEARSLAEAKGSASSTNEIAAHRDAILEQLSQLLASAHFKHSRHYPALLRHVVEQTVEGHTANLKERALGVDVFHRPADYDTNLDPIVRTCACEIRKRIAHYYQEPGRQSEIRIDLPPGSYHPEFHFPVPVAPTVVELPAPALSVVTPGKGRSPWWILFAVGLVPIALAIGAMNLRANHNPVDQFWGPVFASGDSAMIALGHPTRQVAPPAVPTAGEVMQNDSVAFADALAMARITGLIRSQGKRFDIRRTSSFTLNDLRKSPVILIGGFNNSWTMHLEKHLRFFFDRDSSGAPLIRDRKDLSRVFSKGPDSTPYSNVKEDFAIVSRYTDPLTEKMVVTVAGIGKDGTLAAGEFVTEPKYLDMLAARAPAGWDRRNLQVVLATEIVNGIPGPPRILDQCFW